MAGVESVGEKEEARGGKWGQVMEGLRGHCEDCVQWGPTGEFSQRDVRD